MLRAILNKVHEGKHLELKLYQTDSRYPLQSVQFLRALATLIVVFYHTHIILALEKYGNIVAFGKIALKGWLGVNLFFILSGYIIIHAHAKDLGNVAALPGYMWRRFTKIYPLYWILLSLFILGAKLHVGESEFRTDFSNLITAYSLVMVTDQPTLPLKVAWTLLFEVKFYIFFCFVSVFPRAMLCTLLLWFFLIIIRNCFMPIPDWGFLLPDYGMLHVWNVYFIIGIAIWLINPFLNASKWPLYACVSLTALLWLVRGINDMDSNTVQPFFMLELAFALGTLVVAAILCERRFGWASPKILYLIGDASYSIYLSHSAAISLLARLNHAYLYQEFSSEIVFIIIFLIAITLGVITHIVLEKPLIRKLRHRVLPVYAGS